MMIQEFVYKLITIIGVIAVIVFVWEAISAIRQMTIKSDDDDHQ